MKKSLSIILSLLLLLTSCGGPAETPETSGDTQADTSVQSDESSSDESSSSEDQPVQDAEPSYTDPGHDYSGTSPEIPEDLNFNGADFIIFSGYANDYWPVTAEDYSANAVNYAMYTSQLHTETRLDVKIAEEFWYYSVVTDTMSNTIASGDSSFSAFNQLGSYAHKNVLSGAIVPAQNTEYIDITAPWWNPDVTETLSLGVHSFFLSSAANTMLYANTSAVFMNPELANTAGISVDDVYSDVRNGSWTQDKLLEYASLAVSDLDENGVMDKNDRWGLTSYDNPLLSISLIYAGGGTIMVNDDAGIPALTWSSDLFTNRAENTISILNNSSVLRDDSLRYQTSVFTDGRSLFMHAPISTAEQLNCSYTILPMPKYDEAQDGYISLSSDSMIFALPKLVPNESMSGAVLEWLSYEGWCHVKSAFIENALKNTAQKDDSTAEMTDICLDSVSIELGNIYASKWCGFDAIYAMLTENSDIAAHTNKYKNAITGYMRNIQNALNEIQ